MPDPQSIGPEPTGRVREMLPSLAGWRYAAKHRYGEADNVGCQ